MCMIKMLYYRVINLVNHMMFKFTFSSFKKYKYILWLVVLKGAFLSNN